MSFAMKARAGMEGKVPRILHRSTTVPPQSYGPSYGPNAFCLGTLLAESHTCARHVAKLSALGVNQ
jgi:hypothetical protein